MPPLVLVFQISMYIVHIETDLIWKQKILSQT